MVSRAITSKTRSLEPSAPVDTQREAKKHNLKKSLGVHTMVLSWVPLLSQGSVPGSRRPGKQIDTLHTEYKAGMTRGKANMVPCH